MVPLDAELQALAALVAGAFALIVIACSRERRTNYILATFLWLIAANQTCEAIRAAGAPIDPLVLVRLAAIFASLDPVVFLWFFARSEKDQFLEKAILPALFVSSSCALYAGFFIREIPTDFDYAFPVLLTLYTAVTYTLVAWRLASRITSRRTELVFASACVASLPVWVNLPQPILLRMLHANLTPPTSALILALDIAIPLVAAVPMGLTASRRKQHATTAWMILAGVLALTVLLDVYHVLRALTSPDATDRSSAAIVGRAGAALRWLIFSGLMSIVILRYDAGMLPLAYRRRSARLIIGLTLLTVAGYALAFASVTGQASLSWPIGIFLVILLALSQGFRGWIDRVATRLYGLPRLGGESARHEAYRNAVGSLLRIGRTEADESTLARLRAELELDAATALAIERSAELTSVAPLRTGTILAGRYRIETWLGRGGAATTFLAFDQLLRRKVAIKEVFKRDDEDASDVIREARLMGTIQHPNVVQVLDVVQRPDSDLIIEEFVSGGTLAERLTDRPLPAAETKRILSAILEGLAAVHAQGIIHRDLKPANILFDDAGSPKIADFGLALGARTAALPQSGYGTVGFAPPEQAGDGQPTVANDIYGVGAIGRACLENDPTTPLATILDKACAFDPRSRWTSASEMLTALQGVAV